MKLAQILYEPMRIKLKLTLHAHARLLTAYQLIWWKGYEIKYERGLHIASRKEDSIAGLLGLAYKLLP